MFDAETLKTIGQWAPWLVVFAAFVWLVRETIVKQSDTLKAISANMSALAENNKILGGNVSSLQSRVEFWNKDSETAHSFQRKEHEEQKLLIQSLDALKRLA
ncbi:MAG: hypothetical protein WC364_14040 [Eubacteriales bacterium]|jgi:hypothetical protein